MNNARSSLVGRRLLCAAALAAALWPLAACQTPFQQDPADRSWGQYADSILARSLADGDVLKMPIASPTRIEGIRELPRIDSPGPGAVTPGTPTRTLAAAPEPTTAVNPGVTAIPGAVPTTFGTALTQPATAPTTQVSPDPSRLMQAENTYALSLQEAIQRALRHNLDIKVEAYNPAIRESQIVEALAAFDPVLVGQSQFTNQDRPPVEASGNGVNWNNNVAIKKVTPSGATVQLGAGDIYRDLQSPSPFSGIPKSSHEGNVNMSLAQPLLRGFGSNITQANIYLAQKDYQISLAAFRAKVIETVAKVESAYHDLALSITLVDIQQRLLAETRDTDEKTRARQGVDATEVEVAEADAALQARRAELVRAYAQVRNASDALKVLLNDPELDIRTNTLVIPSDKPVDAPITLNIPQQVAIALRQRPEMQEARLQVQRADIIVEVAKNDLLPKLDLTMGVQSSAQANGLDNAMYHTIDAAKFIDYSAGARLEIPLGNRQFEAALRRRNNERRQAITQMLLNAQQIVADVRVALRNMLTSFQEYQARDAARVAAARELAALTQRERVEKLSPEFLRLKLDAQQRLANAAILQIQALISYNKGIMQLEQAKGTLLEYNRVAIGPAPEQVTDKGKIRFLGQTYDLGK